MVTFFLHYSHRHSMGFAVLADIGAFAVGFYRLFELYIFIYMVIMVSN
jgi:hypothetical protein